MELIVRHLRKRWQITLVSVLMQGSAMVLIKEGLRTDVATNAVIALRGLRRCSSKPKRLMKLFNTWPLRLGLFELNLESATPGHFI